jgi:hypothetical protein
MKKKITKMDILKMNKKISREIENEDETGFVCKNKAHKSKKQYKRKKLSLDEIYNEEDDE